MVTGQSDRDVADTRALLSDRRKGGRLSVFYHRAMSARLDPSWSVVASPSTLAVDRCVDIFRRPDGTFGFEEFRRDPEDLGSWTPIAYYSGRQFANEAEAIAAARDAVAWLPAVFDRPS
jgi:hypothetical protein